MEEHLYLRHYVLKKILYIYIHNDDVFYIYISQLRAERERERCTSHAYVSIYYKTTKGRDLIALSDYELSSIRINFESMMLGEFFDIDKYENIGFRAYFWLFVTYFL